MVRKIKILLHILAVTRLHRRCLERWLTTF